MTDSISLVNDQSERRLGNRHNNIDSKWVKTERGWDLKLGGWNIYIKKQEGPLPVYEAAMKYGWGWFLFWGESQVPPYFVGFAQ